MHVMFFHQEKGLDAPTVTCAEVAAFMDVAMIEGATGEPSVTSGFGDDVGVLVDLLPGFFADHDMKGQDVFAAILRKLVLDPVHPPKVLAPCTPSAVEPVFGL